MMKNLCILFTLGLLNLVLLSQNSANACGPTPQKVSKEIKINAPPSQVWTMVKDFNRPSLWNPLVSNAVTQQADDEQGKPAFYRTITLRDGGKVIEKLRETPDEAMKQAVWMEETTLPVSNYHGVMTVKAGSHAHESIVTWTARFSNKANRMDAPAGQDNATAVAAIDQYYEAALAGLKKTVEMQ